MWCVEELELRAQSQGHHSIDRLEERGVRKRQLSTICLQRTRQGQCQSDRHWKWFKSNIMESSERRGGAHIVFPERLDTTLNWTALLTEWGWGFTREPFTWCRCSQPEKIDETSLNCTPLMNLLGNTVRCTFYWINRSVAEVFMALHVHGRWLQPHWNHHLHMCVIACPEGSRHLCRWL